MYPTLVNNNYGQGDPGNEGGCDTDCPKSQQARDLFNNNVLIKPNYIDVSICIYDWSKRRSSNAIG